jgi:septum formation protein
MKLILASSSPRRAEILRQAGIAFEIITAPVNESRGPDEPPTAYVRRLAEAKARAVVEGGAAGQAPAWVVGADTVVLIDGLVLGKPASAAEARRMLESLSGRTHEVLTGVAVLRLPEGAAQIEQELTRVTLAPLSKEEIEDYITTGEPFGKAGAYAIQGRAGRFVTRIEGCYFNIVGLPLGRLYRMLRELGWPGTAAL